MTLPELCIKRPVFATILSVLILLVGALSYQKLTVREYPDVSIPVLSVQTNYPNASPELVENDITFPLEQELSGIEGVESISSQSKKQQSHITLKFKPGTQLDRALSDVRERLSRAKAKLPDNAKEPTVEKKNSDSDPFLYLSLGAENYSPSELIQYAQLYLKNPLENIVGVAQVQIIGTPYLMEITLDPRKMMALGISYQEVLDLLEKHRLFTPAGEDNREIPLTVISPLSTPENFENLVIRKIGNSVITLQDVASIKLTADDKFLVRVNGRNGVLLGIVKTSQGNPLEVSQMARKIMPKLQQSLPPGIKLSVEMDKSTFIQVSLHNVKKTIFEACALVLLIIFLFLRTFRATLIPLVTIPISLIGAFGLMAALGFSINTITLLAMVLAIGLVVDDAIVVLENIYRHIEAGMPPIEAAKKGGREIGFAIIAMTLTLAGVYTPIIFLEGTIGQLFFEFCLTLVCAVIVSGVVALTLSPMMCSRILQPNPKKRFPQIDQGLEWIESMYQGILPFFLNRPRIVAGGFAGVLALSLLFVHFLPQELAPQEDRGIIGVFYPPMPDASKETLNRYVEQGEKIATQIPEAQNILAFIGNWGGNIPILLKPWSQRKRSAKEIEKDLREKVDTIPTVVTHVWNWSQSLPGTDSGGKPSSISVVIQTSKDYLNLFHTMQNIKKTFEDSPFFSEVSHDLQLNVPGYHVTIDELKATLAGLDRQQIARTLEVYYRGARPIEFNKDGIRYDVKVKTATVPQDLSEVYLKNEDDKWVPLRSFAQLDLTPSPEKLSHYDQMRAAKFSLSLASGVSLQEGMSYIDKTFKKMLPSSMKFNYTGSAKQFLESSSMMILIFGLALAFIYSILAIQFESFVDPLIIMLTVPLACVGALAFLWMSGGSLNIFSQIGLVTLIGLVSKHGILIVEFANQAFHKDRDALAAIKQAAHLRLRPILMTTGAMIFGCVPLALTTGAGSEARRSLATVLIGGLLLGTLLTLVVVPTAYLIRHRVENWIAKRRSKTVLSHQ
ncbi:MAG: efflux RND transporter permease subunit [Pseudomonadota bacterium]